jgi:serine/threonine protein phosphatase PrpC
MGGHPGGDVASRTVYAAERLHGLFEAPTLHGTTTDAADAMSRAVLGPSLGLGEPADLEAAARKLVAGAPDRGATDNVTLALLEVS